MFNCLEVRHYQLLATQKNPSLLEQVWSMNAAASLQVCAEQREVLWVTKFKYERKMPNGWHVHVHLCADREAPAFATFFFCSWPSVTAAVYLPKYLLQVGRHWRLSVKWNKCGFGVICVPLCVFADMALGVWSSLSLLRRAFLPLHPELWPCYHSDGHQAPLWCLRVADAEEELQSSPWAGICEEKINSSAVAHLFLFCFKFKGSSVFSTLFFSPHAPSLILFFFPSLCHPAVSPSLPLPLTLSLSLSQYIVLNCPGVSSFENHPFTLTTVRLYATHSSLMRQSTLSTHTHMFLQFLKLSSPWQRTRSSLSPSTTPTPSAAGWYLSDSWVVQ